MADLSVGGLRELLSNGVGGLLLLVPKGLSGMSTPDITDLVDDTTSHGYYVYSRVFMLILG